MKMKKILYSLSLLVCLLGVSENAWAGSFNTWLRVSTDDTAKGLVYASKTKNQTPADSKYGELVLSESVSGSKNKQNSFYGWAKPARGYTFNTWTAYTYAGSDKKKGEGEAKFPSPKQVTGVGDLIYSYSWNGGAGDDQANSAKASWNAATSYNVVYKEPVGGSYTVDYSYVTINSSKKFATSTEKLELAPGSGDKQPYGISDGSQEGYSYAADVVTLTSSAANFEGWYEDGVQKSTGSGATHSYTYPITKTANVTAVFKNAIVATPEEVSVTTNSKTVAKAASVVFDVEATGTWAADGTGFTVTFQSKEGPGDFAVTSKSYSASEGQLTVNFTYTANEWLGTSIEMVVTPAYGEGATATIKGMAEELIDYQARVLVGEDVQQTGTLTAMLALANTLDDTPTLQLTQNVTATATLQFEKSMIFDLNNKKLSATVVDKLILVKGSNTSDKVTLTISDNSYTAAGEIELTRSASATSIGVEIADENKLTLQKGILTVTNSTAAAQGIYISGNGTLLMQGGKVEATANTDARGVFAGNGFATIMNGSIDAAAGTKAYALYTAATSNVSSGVSLGATTTSGAEAVAVYVSGGKTVLDNVTMTADAHTTSAYGANVQAGQLSMNGGTIAATAATPNVYGVYIAALGNATIQQQANITAELTTDATGSTTAQAYGVLNLGTLKLINSNVTAISLKNYATAVESKTSATSTTIEGGTYTAQSATGYAYGLHHQYGTLDVDGGTFSATAAGDNVYGARAAVDGTIANATLSAETTGSAKTAYGFVGGVENKNISLINCTIKAKSATSAAYAIYSRANVTATDCELEAKTLSTTSAHGFYAEKGTNELKNTNATVESFTTNAYGINYLAGTLTVDGGTYSVIARHNKTLTAVDNCLAYGVYVADGKTANLSNASFSVSALNGSFSQNAYGAYTGTGTINSTGCTYNVSAATLSYGVFGNTSSTLNLQNNTINASTVGSTKARGIYSAGTFMVDGDDVTSDTKSYDSYPLYFAAAAHGEVLGGKFMAKGTSTKSSEIIAPINTDASAANVQVKGGFYSDNVRLRYYVPTGYEIYGVDPNAPEYAEKYYYTVDDHLPYDNVCYITEKSVGFPTLEEAFDYARNHSGSSYNIIMIQPYTLPAGNYSLPSNATLVVPDRASRTTAIGTTAQRQCGTQDLITENRCLTFANGVNLDVYGTIEVSAKQYTTNTGRIAYVLGPYGRIHLQEGSTITLNNGAKINAWGYITGQGEIRVKNGATVREFFQVHDMKAASAIPDWTSSTNKNTYKAFVMNQYYIQSVEAPTKYYYGGQLIGSLSITSNATATSAAQADNVKLVGTSDAFFNVDTDDESAWVRKSYNPTTDRVLWETNSSASLGSISISMSSYSIYSKDYVLPFTNNMTVHALTGKLNITQSTVLLPGCEVVVDKTATLHINETDKNEDNMGLYLYDLAQWGKYYESSSKYFLPAAYSPSWTNGVCPRGTGTSNACLKDAALYVEGKIEVEGAIYTTAGGAAIYSDDENAGTIEFSANAAADGNLYRTYNGGGATAVTSAQLRNGGINGSTFTATKGVAAANDTYAYMDIDNDGVYLWTNLATVDACVVQDKNTSVYYAKPQGYVAITSATEDANHLFHSVTGNRLFIQQGMEAGCQWWEVIAVGGGVYYCETNDTYYEYDELDGWVEVKRTVTFYFTDPKSEAADKKKVLTVNYGAAPDVTIVSNPSKAADAAATYQFQGWKYGEDGPVHSYTATDYEAVYNNGTYYLPVFDTITKKYTITFKKAKNNTDVPVECFYGQSPEYAASWASSAQYDYEFTGWKAADNTVYPVGESLPAVTGATYYTAQWTNHTRSYNITWVNGETTLEVDESQPYGTATAFNGTLPTKATDNDYVYSFCGWRSSLTGSTYANGSTPTVAGETTYEAQYTTTPRYAITFNNYDGTQLARTIYTEGEHPAYDGVPARKRDADGYFVFIGWKNGNGTDYAANATLPAVTGKETYTAQYSYTNDLFTITLNNVDGKEATWSGKFGLGSIPFYDPNEDDVPDTPTKAGNAQYSYPFTGWTPSLEPVSGEAIYTAQFGQQTNSYTITFENIDGHGAHEDVVLEYGATPAYSSVVSMYTEGLDIYTFRAWKRESNKQEYTGALPTVVADERYIAQYDKVDNLAITGNTTITSDASLGTTTVYVSGALNVSDDATFTTTNLILKAEAGGSGQIYKEPSSNISATNVYYDLSLNTDARHWRAFGVPWAVDLNTNKLEEVDNNGIVIRTLNISHDYEIMYFDGAERAANGPSPACWKYLRHYEDTEHGQPVDVLTPGRGYMIAFGSHVNTVRFTKKNGAPIIFDGTVSVAAGQIRGISNPMAYHVTLSNIGATVGQVHDGGEIGHDDYTEVDIDDKRFVVGKTVYIEPAASGTVAVNKADGGVSPIAAAPARRGMATDKQYLSLSDYYTVALTPEDGSQVAKVYVLPEEDKEDRYVAGHDLVKMGMSDRKAQIWVERYDAQLGLNTTAPMNGVAEFPIYVYAPKAGEYTIGLASQPDDDYTVYLLRDGVAIWDLSTSEYALTLGTGKDNSFALRLSARKSPEVATGVDEAIVDAQGETRKVLIDNKVFIIRGNQVYTIDGQLVK